MPLGTVHPNTPTPSASSIREGTGTLASLVPQGWQLQPPGPNEVGPSNWMERSSHVSSNDPRMVVHFDNELARDVVPPSSPVELRNLSSILNNRFCISPPILADVFNPLLQDQVGTGT